MKMTKMVLKSCSKRTFAVLLLCMMIWQVRIDFTNSQPCLGSTQEPSLGDIMIDDDGVVKVFYSDGTQELTWAPICADTAERSVFDVICRQLGLQGQTTRATRFKNNVNAVNPGQAHGHKRSSSWFHHISCGDDPTHYSHILQCKQYFTSSCTDILKNVPCMNPSQPRYEGWVRLCPSDDFPVDRCSVSTGLVQLYLHNQLRGINQNTSQRLETQVADSICRQLGYTSAVVNSAVIARATNLSFSHCYEENSLVKHAWFTTDQLHCDIARECVGCCFTYPKHANQLCPTCDKANDVVISCTFDPTSVITSPIPKVEKSKVCAFHNNVLDGSSCSAQDTYSLEILLLSSIIPSGVTVLLCVIIMVLFYSVCRCCKNNQYRPLRDNPDPRENNRQEIQLNQVPQPPVEPIADPNAGDAPDRVDQNGPPVGQLQPGLDGQPAPVGQNVGQPGLDGQPAPVGQPGLGGQPAPVGQNVGQPGLGGQPAPVGQPGLGGQPAPVGEHGPAVDQ